MTVAACPACRAAQRDTLLCKTCMCRLIDSLRLVLPDDVQTPAGPPWERQRQTWAGFDVELEVTLTRTGKRAPSLGGGRSAAQPLPFDEGASKARDGLHAALAKWVLNLAHPDGERWPHAEAASMAAWLLERRDRIRCDLDAAEAYTDITTAVDRVLRTIGGPPARRLIGRCGVCQGGHVYARLDEDNGTCNRCARVVIGVQARRERMLAEVGNACVTQREARALLAERGVLVSKQRFANWIRRGRIVAATTDRDARPLYRLSDVETLAVTSANNPRPQA